MKRFFGGAGLSWLITAGIQLATTTQCIGVSPTGALGIGCVFSLCCVKG